MGRTGVRTGLLLINAAVFTEPRAQSENRSNQAGANARSSGEFIRDLLLVPSFGFTGAGVSISRGTSGLKISRPDDLHDVACAAAQASVHCEETAPHHPCQRDVLSVVRLHPAELLGDSPRFAP